jgi:hypothetical protein
MKTELTDEERRQMLGYVDTVKKKVLASMRMSFRTL